MKRLSAKVRAYARTIDAGVRTINEVEEDYRVAAYIELIARYDLAIEDVDPRYIEQVKSALGVA